MKFLIRLSNNSFCSCTCATPVTSGEYSTEFNCHLPHAHRPTLQRVFRHYSFKAADIVPYCGILYLLPANYEVSHCKCEKKGKEQ